MTLQLSSDVREGAPPGALSPRALLSHAATVVFDMDGVLFDSAHAKTEAFRRAALPYGAEAAEAMAALHRTAGSSGRRVRVERFFAEVLCLPEVAPSEVTGMMERIGEALHSAYAAAEMLPGAMAFLEATGRDRLLLVSGVAEDELRSIVERRRVAHHFRGIYGGDKHAILPRLVTEGAIVPPAVYLGDTPDDEDAARAAGMDFVFVARCSEFTLGDFSGPTAIIRDFTEVLA